MEVVPADDECAGHLGTDTTTGQDTSTNGDIAGEGALLVYSRVIMLGSAHTAQS